MKKRRMTSFEPVDDLSPAGLRYLAFGKFDYKSISSEIVFLVERGCISIKRTERKDGADFIYEIKKEKDLKGVDDTRINQLVLDFLFSYGEEVVGSTIESDQLIHYSNDHYKKALMEGIKRSVEDELVEKGLARLSTGPMFIFKNIMLFVLFFYRFISNGVWRFSRVLVFTAKGDMARAETFGFAEFLSVVEQSRYEYFNNPDDMKSDFREYLSCAVALDVNADWEKEIDWYVNFDSVLEKVTSSLSRSEVNNFWLVFIVIATLFLLTVFLVNGLATNIGLSWDF